MILDADVDAFPSASVVIVLVVAVARRRRSPCVTVARACEVIVVDDIARRTSSRVVAR
jgi:hypothetical protein